MTSTGAKADHRLAVPAAKIEDCPGRRRQAWAIAGDGAGTAAPHDKWAAAVASDLRAASRPLRRPCRRPAAARRPSPGPRPQPHLGNVGQTVLHTEPVAGPTRRPDCNRCASWSEDMEQGRVEVLLILGGNPVYTARPISSFAEQMQKVPLRVHLSLYQDETSRQCHWHLPEAHYLEAWSDTRAFDGTASIVQPLIEPLYHGRSAHELLAVAQPTRLQTPGYEIVRGLLAKALGRTDSGAAISRTRWQTAAPRRRGGRHRSSRRGPYLCKDGWEKHLPARHRDRHGRRGL